VDSMRMGDAIERIDTLDASMRDSSACQTLLATCLLGVGDKPRAREVLERLAADSPDSARTRMMLGALEFAEGNTEAAMRHLSEVAAAEPRLPGLHNKLGQVLLETKQYDEAIAAFEKALEIDGDSPLAFTGRARAKLELGDAQSALDDAMIAAELVHFLPRAHYLVGRSLAALGRPTEAVEALELCVKQAPGMSLAHQELAGVYRTLGDNAKAREAELRAGRVLA
jgi:protein O-GlcNAc transferase